MSLKIDKKDSFVIGIDEVGRGPIAGPVCVCAFMLKKEEYDSFVKEVKDFLALPLRDSKKLTKKCREKWFAYLRKQKEKGLCDYKTTFVSNEMIDKFGIAKCIEKAVNESLRKITSQNLPNFSRFTPEGPYTDKNLEDSVSRTSFQKNTTSYKILLDGGLKAPKEFENQESFVKGDELHPVISLASIIAKVSRDKIMENYAGEHKEYGFEKNSGYGTRGHYEAIKKHGITPIHRKSFLH